MDDFQEGFEVGMQWAEVSTMRQLRAERDRYREALVALGVWRIDSTSAAVEMREFATAALDAEDNDG